MRECLSVNERMPLCAPSLLLLPKQNVEQGVEDNLRTLSVFLIAGSMPVQYLALPEGVVKSGRHPYSLAFKHIR